jgi:hypothetical protein
MTQRPRRTTPAQVEITDTPLVQDSVPEPAPTPAPTTAGLPVDRLSVLRYYADSDGLLPVLVAVAHDAVFLGQHLRVPITDRVAGLIEIGFLEVEPPEPDDQP